MYSGQHHAWRERVLSKHPTCQGWPRERECRARSIVADHIAPLSQGGNWLDSNGQGLCLSCAGRKSRSERGYGR